MNSSYGFLKRLQSIRYFIQELKLPNGVNISST